MGKLFRSVSAIARTVADFLFARFCILGKFRNRRVENLMRQFFEQLAPRLLFTSWLGAGSDATFDSSTHILDVAGPTTIIADPGSDEPIIIATGSNAQVNFGNSKGSRVNAINLSHSTPQNP